MDWTPVVTAAIGATVGLAGAVAVFYKTRTESHTAQAATAREDRVDVIEHLSTELAAARQREQDERKQVEFWRSEYYRLLVTTERGVAALQAVADEHQASNHV